MNDQPKQRFPLAIAIALALVTLAVYWPVRNFEYINYDDQDYVYENPQVTKGLSSDSVRWAFTTDFAANWHPLTWLSLMLDCELFGVKPGAHHTMNVSYHIGATVILFVVLFYMTGAAGRSGFVAALFALHPLHVESVAWVAERKDVLSGLFWMITMAAYLWYTRRPGAARYLVVMISFALGLMAKPMLVTLPCVLLLLDYWPLNRWDSFVKRFVEKLPLFVLTIASSAITFLVQQKGGAVESLQEFPFFVRLGNALVAYVSYLGKALLPEDLAVLYPHPGGWSALAIIGAALLLLLVTFAVLYISRTRRYALVGWLWYLGTLVPVAGFVQVGEQFMADRYTYIPLIGVFIMLVWAAYDCAQGMQRPKLVLGFAGVVVLAVSMIGTMRQLQYWRNSVTLFSHTVSVTRSNATAHYNLAQALSVRGFPKEALPHYERAIEIRPKYPEAHNNLGLTLAILGQPHEATNHYVAALQASPSHIAAHINYGFSLLTLHQPESAAARFAKAIELGAKDPLTYDGLGQAYHALGKSDEAIAQFRKALALDSRYSEAHYHLGLALAQQGKNAEALTEMERALRLTPGVPDIHSQLGLILNAEGKTKEAIAHYREALRLNPDFMQVLNNMAWLLATHPAAEFRNGPQAVEYAERACELSSYKIPHLVGTLAAAYAEAGQFDEAVQNAKQAEELALKYGQRELAETNRKLRELYAAKKPHREPPHQK